MQAPPAEGLDWTSIGLGAGGGIALATISAGGVLLITRRGAATRPRIG